VARLLLKLKANASEVNLPYPVYAPQPNESFNADANIGHGFAIFMANVGALRPYGLRRRLTRALGSRENNLWNSGSRVFCRVDEYRTGARANANRDWAAGVRQRLYRAACPWAASSPLSSAKVPCALAFSGCPSQAASGRLSGAKVPHALAWLAACPLAVSTRLFATANAVAKASRHRGCATLTLCVWRVSCASSGTNTACALARALRQVFGCSGPLHEQEFMQTECATKLSAGIVFRPWNLDKIRLQSSAFAQRAPATSEARTEGANAAMLSNQVVGRAVTVALAHKPNESFNADANIGHRFAILMANVSALRASRSGAG
jgi:hypothetical protein